MNLFDWIIESIRWMQQTVFEGAVLPGLYAAGWMHLAEPMFDFTEWAVIGAIEIGLLAIVLGAMERVWPAEAVSDRAAIRTDMAYTLLHRLGGFALLTFALFQPLFDAIESSLRAEHGFGHTAAMYSTNIDALHKMARAMDVSIFVKNAPTYAGLGLGGEGYTSFTIASPTGEGLTTAISFSRERRCTLKDHFRIV
jgi:hypothetical protein